MLYLYYYLLLLIYYSLPLVSKTTADNQIQQISVAKISINFKSSSSNNSTPPESVNILTPATDLIDVIVLSAVIIMFIIIFIIFLCLGPRSPPVMYPPVSAYWYRSNSHPVDGCSDCIDNDDNNDDDDSDTSSKISFLLKVCSTV